MMATRAPSPYDARRDRLAAYFDGTAQKAWIDLTSDVKVSGIRATVRAGRDAMRSTLLSWLPNNLHGARLMDAGCGTGALSLAAAGRGASVLAIDVAGGLVDIAQTRAGHAAGSIDWRTGDMLDPSLGTFDYVVAMDSLIHYEPDDMVAALAKLGHRCTGSMLFTFAPRTPLLAAMHRVGKLFPRGNRSPAIVPVAEEEMRERLARLAEWKVGRSHRVVTGFYKSHALELARR